VPSGTWDENVPLTERAMKFDHSHYVPILKGRQGELDALRRTKPKLLGKFTPLIEVPPIPPKYLEGQEEPVPGKTIDKHVADVAKNFVKALAQLPAVFVDAFYIEVADELADGSSPVDFVFNSLRKGKVAFIPVIGLDRVEDYADSVKAAIQADKRGCCFRLWEPDLESIADLGGQVESLRNTLGVTPGQVDLLVDFGPKVPSKALLPFLIDALPQLSEWRTLTISSSSFPANMTGIGQNKIEEREREEWLAWLVVRSKQQSVKRMPTYSDYAINHPEISDLDFRLMNASPNIRYTDQINFVIAKGQAQPRKKKAITPEQKAHREKLAAKIQFPKLANMIKQHSSWKGAIFSWGDEFIDQCSRKECVGSPTDWRAVGTSHHIALVVQQLANLP
jgi:hypothetical protein